VLAKSLEARLGALAGGQAAMITSSGELLYAQAPQSTVWASHGGRCRAVFDLGGPDGASSSTEEG
jgi:hypothetical protein